MYVFGINVILSTGFLKMDNWSVIHREKTESEDTHIQGVKNVTDYRIKGTN